MSCLIEAANLKIFGKAFHALVRIADDLYIEALPSGLVFHTVNSSKSAYACFTFKPDFFVTYKGDSTEKRKVLLKSCLMAFRSLPNLDKTVEKCLFDLISSPDYLLLKFFCKHGMVKIYQLPYVENETVQGSFPTSGFLCQLNASSRLLQDGIQNFSTSVEEVTLTVCSKKVLLRNYVDDEPEPNKVVHTELTLESEEFELFDVEQETKITFCLKELKAVLNFCEGFNVPISIKCQTGGRPVTFSVTGLRGVDVQFVLATLADRESQSFSSSGVFRSSVAQISQFGRSVHAEYKDKKKNQPDTQSLSNGSQPKSFTSSVSNSHKIQPLVLTLSDDDEDIMLQDPAVDNDVIPSTPPHKKFRSMFLGLSQATCTTMVPDPDEVLVVNSDDELM